MKLYEAFQDRGFHTAIVTTFGVDFDAFESIALSRLRGAGCRNVMLACDAGMLGIVLAEAGRSPKFAGASYIVAKARASGVFHPKVIVQVGKDRGRLIVASANATASGLAGNLELATVIECHAEDSSERRLVLAGWNYALRFFDQRQKAVEDKLRWARARTDWLDAAAVADEAVDLSDGTRAAFLATGVTTGLAKRFYDLVGSKRPAERLVVLSPYWDEDLSALGALQTAFRPRKTVLLIDTERKLFPATALTGKAKIQVSKLQGFDKSLFPSGNRRFIHAKMIVVTVGGMDHVLVGSANCTFAALGNARRSNEEACLYRRFPTGKLFDALGLEPLLRKNKAIDVRKIPKQELQKNLPLNETVENDPGAFELAYESLLWWPASKALADAATKGRAILELIDVSMKPLARKTDLLPDSGNERTFRIAQGDKRPAFARFRLSNGTATGFAIIASVEDLRQETRDPLTARAERAIHDLELEDDEGLWLLDVIQALSTPETGKLPSLAPRSTGTQKKTNAPTVVGDLDYDSFMRGRRREIRPSEAEHNSLAGSHVSYVRAALNRLLGMAGAPIPEDDVEDDESKVADALDTGDEVGGAENALEQGFDPQDPKQSPKAAVAIARQRQHADADAITYAVDTFTEELRQPNRALDAIDMLRLRAMLMIIGVAGKPNASASTYKPSQMQVLPSSDGSQGETWPRLMGRVLGVVFFGPDPAIRRLRFDKGHDRLPDDVLETWACCIWSALAAAAAARLDPGCIRLSPLLARLAASVQALLPLSNEEVTSPSFIQVVESLDKRLGPRLQILPLKAACMVISQPTSTRVSTTLAIRPR
jgi:hypothetical protein